MSAHLLQIYYEPATKDRGNIRQPMALQALGKILTCHNYMPQNVGGGKRGYFVVEHTNNEQDAQKIIEELNQ